MPKRAMVAIKELAMNLETATPKAAMEQRRRLAGLIRARMAQPATRTEKSLWQELKSEIEKERVTFRS